jgi:hypothetical protein
VFEAAICASAGKPPLPVSAAFQLLVGAGVSGNGPFAWGPSPLRPQFPLQLLAAFSRNCLISPFSFLADDIRPAVDHQAALALQLRAPTLAKPPLIRTLLSDSESLGKCAVFLPLFLRPKNKGISADNHFPSHLNQMECPRSGRIRGLPRQSKREATLDSRHLGDLCALFGIAQNEEAT